ncbi:MAG TPA: Maf family protein [Puia sp.]
MDRIILASASPRRKQLLEWAEIPFDVIPSDSDETVPDQISFSEIPVFLASQKAAIVRKITAPEKIILAADTIVVLDQQMLGKPLDRSDAIRMLLLLSGKVHEVITGVALTNSKKEIFFAETTRVRFHSLTRAEIEHYVDHYQPYDKAGAYAIQEWIGVTGIRSIDGDFYNVMGLPVSRVLQELRLF